MQSLDDHHLLALVKPSQQIELLEAIRQVSVCRKARYKKYAIIPIRFDDLESLSRKAFH